MVFECCYKCQIRHVGCHSYCPKYEDARDELDELQKRRRKYEDDGRADPSARTKTFVSNVPKFSEARRRENND